MTKLIQIVPIPSVRLFGQMVKKEVELSRRNRGTFRRSAGKVRDRAKWSHSKYNGWIKLQRTEGEVVTVEVQSRSQTDDQWQLLHAFIGWVDRHFGDQVEAMHIHYRR
jgi:hypothetical protein